MFPPMLGMELFLHTVGLNIKSGIPIRKEATVSEGKGRVFTTGPRSEISNCTKEKQGIPKPAGREAATQGWFSHYSKKSP